MCGFLCSLFFEDKIDEDFLRDLEDASKLLKHRGPDDEGFYLSPEGNLFMSHRRLSILDLSPRGHQPMLSEDGRFVVVFNGEIYNFKEIRKNLEGKHNFFSNCDTEVLLRLFIEKREGMFEEINGMFSFVIWDSLERELFVGRDILGQKPLYYFQDEEKILFSSEIKPLLKLKKEKKLSKEGFFSFMVSGSVIGSNSIFCGVKKFPPSSYLKIRLSTFDGNLTFKNYLSRIEVGECDIPKVIRESVRKRLIADVKVGLMLSGGVDSSVVAITSSKFARDLETYTVVFGGGNRYDESYRVREFTTKIGLKNKKIKMGYGDFTDSLEKVFLNMEEPVNNPIWSAIYLISNVARRDNVKVLLSGDGGDEIFFGYSRWILYYRLIRFFSLFHFLPHRTLNEEFNYRKKMGIPLFTGKSNYKIVELKKILNGDFFTLDKFCEFIEFERSFFEKFFPEKRLDQWMSYISIRTNFIEDFLMRNDKMGMLNSLEIRSPLLDKNLFFGGISLSKNRRFKGGKGKVILRDFLKEEFERWYSDLKKIGFCAPIHVWFGDLKNKGWIEKLLDINRRENIFKEKFLIELKEMDLLPINYKLFTLYIFQKWYEKWLM